MGEHRAARTKFRFGSGRLCFAFTGTLGDRGSRTPLERLAEPSDLERWAKEAGLSSRVRASAQDLLDARRLREVIYEAADAMRGGGHPTSNQRALLNSWAARPALAPQIGADGTLRWHDSESTHEVLATVAQDAVTALVDHRGRLRVCANPECRGLFVDLSRPGTRRWCSMATCGNQAKKATYRARHGPARA
jgi:predicted RNA-binding Zn ribbon-like protein